MIVMSCRHYHSKRIFFILTFNDPIETFVTNLYPDSINNYKNSNYLKSGTILALTTGSLYITKLISSTSLYIDF